MTRTKCRAYDALCINPKYCDANNACCAGDMSCTPDEGTDISPDSWLCSAFDMANKHGGGFSIQNIYPHKKGMVVQVLNKNAGESWAFHCWKVEK